MLELGSGTGKLSFLLQKYFKYVFGVDSSSSMVNYAKSKCDKYFSGDFIVADFRYLLLFSFLFIYSFIH